MASIKVLHVSAARDSNKLSGFDMCLTVRHQYNKAEDQIDATVTIY